MSPNMLSVPALHYTLTRRVWTFPVFAWFSSLQKHTSSSISRLMYPLKEFPTLQGRMHFACNELSFSPKKKVTSWDWIRPSAATWIQISSIDSPANPPAGGWKSTIGFFSVLPQLDKLQVQPVWRDLWVSCWERQCGGSEFCPCNSIKASVPPTLNPADGLWAEWSFRVHLVHPSSWLHRILAVWRANGGKSELRRYIRWGERVESVVGIVLKWKHTLFFWYWSIRKPHL